MSYVPSGSLSQGKGRRGRSQGAMEPPSQVTYGKVIAINMDDYTVDVVLVAMGTPLHRVPVAVNSAGTKSGELYLERFSNLLGKNTQLGPTGSYVDDRTRTVYAVITYVSDDINSPLVIGFILPPTTQMLFDRDGFSITRHESDLYSTIENGLPSTYDSQTDTTISNYEWVHPSGFFVRVGVGSDHEDLTGKDVQRLARFRGTSNANTPLRTPGPDTADYVPVTVKHPSGTGVVLDDNFNIQTSPTGKAEVNGCEILTECSDLTAIAPVPIFDLLGHALVDAHGNPVLMP